MGTFLTFFFSILTLWVAAMVIQHTGSFVVGMLSAIVVVMLWKTFQVPILIVWDRFSEKHFPLPKITHFFEMGFDQQPENGMLAIELGMRVLIITEDYEYNEENSQVFFKMVEASTNALREQYPLFDLRYRAVQKRKSPIQYNSSLCGEDGELIEKCYKAWGKTEAVFKMTAREKLKDLFLYDGGMAVNGKLINYTSLYLFDQTLPVTVQSEEKVEGENSVAQIAGGEDSQTKGDSDKKSGLFNRLLGKNKEKSE